MTNKSKNSQNARVPGWIWLLTGTLLGALIMFLMRLTELEPPMDKASRPITTTAEDTQEPRFEFYRMLRDAEVPVLRRDPPPSTTPENVEYLLQVASFRAPSDAEQVRAELTLLNLAARVEAANVNQGGTWHRVIVGPFDSRAQLARARDTLLSNRYEALLLQRKPSG